MTTTDETVFDRILRGEIPCHKVYEDGHMLAFLDIAPLSHGHTLVIPKERAATLDQLSDEASAAIGRVLPRISRAIQQVTGVAQFNILQNNGPRAHQAVFHVHFHIIPKPSEETGLQIGWPAGSLNNNNNTDINTAQELAARLSDAITSEPTSQTP